MTSTDLKDLKLQANKTFSTCSLAGKEEVEEAVLGGVKKLLKSNLLKRHCQSPLKIFIMAKLSRWKIKELVAVKNVTVRVDKKFKSAKTVKVKVW